MAFGRLPLLAGALDQFCPRRALPRRAWLVLCLGLALHGGLTSGGALWQEEELRLRVGLKLFPAVLGAVESLGERVSSEGDLVVAAVYTDSPDAARQVVSALQTVAPIRGHPLRIITLDAQTLDTFEGGPLAGVFVASTGVQGARLRAWSERLRTLVFSPFAGDVESGALAGIHVSDQILPFLNLDQARRAGVRFKPFLLRVARHHG